MDLDAAVSAQENVAALQTELQEVNRRRNEHQTRGVEKLPSANTLEVTRGVEQALKELRHGLPGVKIDTTVFRLASYIEDSISNLTQAIIIGTILVILVIGAFLFNWRSALVSSAERCGAPSQRRPRTLGAATAGVGLPREGEEPLFTEDVSGRANYPQPPPPQQPVRVARVMASMARLRIKRISYPSHGACRYPRSGDRRQRS